MMNFLTRIALTTFTVATLLAPSATTFAGSSTLIVDNDRQECPDAPFTSIQEAIDVAKPGDTVLVCPGTYVKQIVITKKLTLLNKAVTGKLPPLLVAQDIDKMIRIENTQDVTVGGFRVWASNATAVAVEQSPNVTVQEMHISDAHVGIDNTSAKATIRDNILTGGSTAIFVSGSQAKISGNKVNGADTGLLLTKADKAQVNKNRVTSGGVGIIADGATNSTFSDNETDFNSIGIGLFNGATKNTFSNGSAQSNIGRGISVAATSSDNTIKGYLAQGGESFDVGDDSVGSKTGGTANTYSNNTCDTSNRSGLCAKSATVIKAN